MNPSQSEVLTTLLDRQREFRAFLARRLGDDTLADDVLQDVLTKSLDRLDTLRDPNASVAWFYRALRNAVVDVHRRQGATRRKLDAFAVELDGAPSEETEREVCKCVLSIAENLKPEYAEALRRTTIDEVPTREYAAEAGIGANNAAVRAMRARKALEREVHATCGACASGGCGECTCGK